MPKPDQDFSRARAVLTATLAGALLAACGTAPPPPEPLPPVSLATAPVTPPAADNGPATVTPAQPGNISRLLAYADRVRTMSPTELGVEQARLADPTVPADQVRLALVLSQLRQLPELIRAQEVLARVLGNAEAQALHPLARLLASRYAEQRRVEEQLEKQNQQLRDVQRRLDQTTERLEALKAIERSLNSRPPAPAASAPVPRARATTP